MPKPPPSFASGPSVFELEEVAEVKLNTWCKAGCGPGSWPASTTSTTAGEVVAGNQPPQRIPRASVITSLISEAVVRCDMETQAWSNYLNSEFLTIYLRCSLGSACSLPLFAVFFMFFLCFFISSFPLYLLSLSLSFFFSSTREHEVVCQSNPTKYNTCYRVLQYVAVHHRTHATSPCAKCGGWSGTCRDWLDWLLRRMVAAGGWSPTTAARHEWSSSRRSNGHMKESIPFELRIWLKGISR